MAVGPHPKSRPSSFRKPYSVYTGACEADSKRSRSVRIGSVGGGKTVSAIPESTADISSASGVVEAKRTDSAESGSLGEGRRVRHGDSGLRLGFRH